MVVVNNVPQLIDKKEGRSIQPKTAEGDDKHESQWTPDARRVVVQDQRLKSIIMLCLRDDIIESVISCEITKATWSDLVHSFEGLSDTKENRIMDLKLEYQTFRAKPTESLSHTYTRYKTLLNELANDGVNLFQHEINVGFVNSLPEKWLTLSQGLRNANHTQTIALSDIYESTVISTAFFSNNVIQDFQENSDDEVDERSYLRDLDIEFHEIALLANSKQVSDDDEVTQVKVQMALADDELTVGNNHARNGEWIDITMRKGASPSSEVMPLTFQPHSLKERPGLGIMKHTKPKTQDSLNKSILGTVTVSKTEPTTPSVPTKVKDTKQESKINELTKLVQMLIYEKVNSTQKTQESNSHIQQTESSKEDHRTSDHDMYTASLKRSENYKAQPYQYASPSKQILKAKAKPFPLCTHCGFNDHRPDDYRNYPECGICGKTHQGAYLVPGQWMLKEYDWCQELSAQIYRATRVWKSIRYDVSKGLDTAYWSFLGVGTTFDIFQNIHILYIEYGVLTSSGYGVLSLFPLWSLVSAGTDTPYLP
ncbi:hypothetical protein Tco_0775604 [Tanacetum coccineum]